MEEMRRRGLESTGDSRRVDSDRHSSELPSKQFTPPPRERSPDPGCMNCCGGGGDGSSSRPSSSRPPRYPTSARRTLLVAASKDVTPLETPVETPLETPHGYFAQTPEETPSDTPRLRYAQILAWYVYVFSPRMYVLIFGILFLFLCFAQEDLLRYR